MTLLSLTEGQRGRQGKGHIQGQLLKVKNAEQKEVTGG